MTETHVILFQHPQQVGLLPHGHKTAAATPGTKSLHEQMETGGGNGTRAFSWETVLFMLYLKPKLFGFRDHRGLL